MTKKQICEMFTKKVAEFMNNGYVITPDSFAGSDGTSRVDLTKDDSFIRIYMDEEWAGFDRDILVFRICEKKLTQREANRIYYQDIIWTKDLEVIEEYKFVIMDRYSGKPFYLTEEEYDAVKDKIADRSKRKGKMFYDSYYVDLPEEAKKVVISFMRRQPKCKSVKLSDITRVSKKVSDGCVVYYVSCKNQTYRIK